MADALFVAYFVFSEQLVAGLVVQPGWMSKRTAPTRALPLTASCTIYVPRDAEAAAELYGSAALLRHLDGDGDALLVGLDAHGGELYARVSTVLRWTAGSAPEL